MARFNLKYCVTVNRIFTSIRVERHFFKGHQNYSNDMKSHYRTRNITEADIPRIAHIRKTLNIHDCVSSLHSFHALDPEAIIVAEDGHGNIIGTHSMLNFAKGLYISGLTYVQQNYRKTNLAIEMIRQETVRHRIQNRLLVTYTFEGWAKNSNEILEFKVNTGFTIKRYISAENVDASILSQDLSKEIGIHPFEMSHLGLLHDYDMRIAGYERRSFLNLSLKEPNSKTLIALKNGYCVGFGSAKLSCPGAKRIGPLYADDPKIAEALLKCLIEGFHEGEGLVVVIPTPNSEAQKLMSKLNMPFNDGLYQLYESGLPRADALRAYALFDVNGTSI